MIEKSVRNKSQISTKDQPAERKRNQEALRLPEQITALNRVMQSPSSTLDLSTILDTILRELQYMVPYDSASVLLSKDDNLEIIAVQGFPDPDEVKGLSFKFVIRRYSKFRSYAETRTSDCWE